MTLNMDKCYEYIGVFSVFEGGDRLKQQISVPEAGSLKLGCHHGQFLGEGPLPGLQTTVFSLYLHMVHNRRERKQAPSSLFLEGH